MEYEDDIEFAPSGCISFITLHQSKGLEFPIVIVSSQSATPRKQYNEDVERIIEIYSDTKIPDLCSITSKCVTNFIVVILGVGFAFLISILLTIFSVGAFL